MQVLSLRRKKKSLTFFLLEGVRHDGICSGNQAAVLSPEFKAQFRKRRGPLVQLRKSFQWCQSLRSVNFSTWWRSRAQQNTSRLTVFAKVFIFLASGLDDPGCRVWLVLEPSCEWQLKAGGMKLSSVQKGTGSVSRGGGVALVKHRACHCVHAGWECFWKRRARQRGWSESSWLSTLHVRETVHRASLALWADRPPAL